MHLTRCKVSETCWRRTLLKRSLKVLQNGIRLSLFQGRESWKSGKTAWGLGKFVNFVVFRVLGKNYQLISQKLHFPRPNSSLKKNCRVKSQRLHFPSVRTDWVRRPSPTVKVAPLYQMCGRVVYLHVAFRRILQGFVKSVWILKGIFGTNPVLSVFQLLQILLGRGEDLHLEEKVHLGEKVLWQVL